MGSPRSERRGRISRINIGSAIIHLLIEGLGETHLSQQ
jgi:hypothetical protein